MMILFRSIALFLTVITVPSLGTAQQAASADTGPVRSSAAYAEVLLRTTEVKAELESLAADYTETSTRIVDLRSELNALSRAIDRLVAVRPSEAAKLTTALGKLLVRKAALDADLERLSRSYTSDNTAVKRARKKVEIYDAAIKEIIP
jgi:chromosome segregation ATPase